MGSLSFPLEFPLELTDFICEKINRKLLVDICCDDSQIYDLYILNRKRLEKYLSKIDIDFHDRKEFPDRYTTISKIAMVNYNIAIAEYWKIRYENLIGKSDMKIGKTE